MFFKIIDDPEIGQVLFELSRVREDDAVAHENARKPGEICLRVTARLDIATDVTMVVVALPEPAMLRGSQIIAELDYAEYTLRFREPLHMLCSLNDDTHGRGSADWN